MLKLIYETIRDFFLLIFYCALLALVSLELGWLQLAIIKAAWGVDLI